jgi:ABC-type sugar transport system ATPase subunit
MTAESGTRPAATQPANREAADRANGAVVAIPENDDVHDALLVSAVRKAFGPTEAVRDASLALRRGEIHCVVGENGSGKSTLVKILSGVHRPDAGTIRIRGQEWNALSSPKAANRAGIATVFQEILVVEPRSVLDNIWLGAKRVLRRRVPAASQREAATEILELLLDQPPPLDVPVESLSLSDRQACCIARALVRDPGVLILDEATSALDVETRDRLFHILRDLAAKGVGVIFISHRMDEIDEIGDRCTVMRSGRTIATLERGDATTAELVRLMTGADHLSGDLAREQPRRLPGAVVLRARGVVLGLAGLEGHGQDAFLRALWGQHLFAGEVTYVASDGWAVVGSPAAATAHGIGYVPRDRRAESLFASKSIRENFGIVTLRQDTRWGLLRPALTRERLRGYVDRLKIKAASADQLITTLSGGNQQKVVMARWLATEPKVLLLNDPTRGVDIAAKRDLYQMLLELAGQGVGIVMLSTEVDEHVELMDRVLVFREHELFTELTREQVDRQTLVSAFFGRSDV